MTADQANLKTAAPSRRPRLGLEISVALAGTAFAAFLLVLTAMHAGPLWRDEVNTINVAQMPSLKELWNNLAYESYPPLWPLLLRGWNFLGLAGSDAGIRALGLLVGLSFLAALWLCARWTGARAPMLSVALMGGLPAFIFIIGANRAYGLASCLLVLSFGTLWRVVESPSRARVLSAGVACFLFAHCVYYDVVFLCAMLAGGSMVTIGRRRWLAFWALVGIGAVSGGTMAIYLPIVHGSTAIVPMVQQPLFDSSILWEKLCEAVTARSSRVTPTGFNGPEIWLWIVLFLGGAVVALAMQRANARQMRNLKETAVNPDNARTDLALFCAVTMLFGVLGYMLFLFRLQFLTQTWYYFEMLALCAIGLDGLLAANWPALRPWGLLRIGFMVAMLAWNASAAWEESHTRRSNVDQIANALGQNARSGDLIIIHSVWEGITFDRYYHGQARWMTVPPVDSHKVHRTDLVHEKMNQPDAMAPVLREIASTLLSGHSVWLVGHVNVGEPEALLPSRLPANQWLGSYLTYWSAQMTTELRKHALAEKALEIPVTGPVCHLENLPVDQFSGYKPDAN